jgi:hypothetical protein
MEKGKLITTLPPLFKFGQTRKKKMCILYGNYKFVKNLSSASVRYECSRRKVTKCKAHITFDEYGNILMFSNDHAHPSRDTSKKLTNASFNAKMIEYCKEVLQTASQIQENGNILLKDKYLGDMKKVKRRSYYNYKRWINDFHTKVEKETEVCEENITDYFNVMFASSQYLKAVSNLRSPY